NLNARRKLFQREQLNGVVALVDSSLHHVEQRTVQKRRRVVEMDFTQLEPGHEGAPGAVVTENHFRIGPAGEVYTTHQTRIVSAGKGQRPDDPALLEAHRSPNSVRFALETNFAGALGS